MFESIIPVTGLTVETAIICISASLVLGAVAALFYRVNNKRASKNLMVSLVILPALVQSVIMLVNGSVGAGIAVMGAFNLVRFRSTPGNSRDICYIFYAMGIGLATGMGYVAFAAMLTLIVGAALLILGFIPAFAATKDMKLLKIVIPEDLDYSGCFDDIFSEYCSKSTLILAKTVSMGTLYELRYEISLKDSSKEKEMIDKLRCRNGNLTISCGLLPKDHEEL